MKRTLTALLAMTAALAVSCTEPELIEPENGQGPNEETTDPEIPEDKDAFFLEAIPQAAPATKNHFTENLSTIKWGKNDHLTAVLSDAAFSSSKVYDFRRADGTNLFQTPMEQVPDAGKHQWLALHPEDAAIAQVVEADGNTVLADADGKPIHFLIDPGTQKGLSNMLHVKMPMAGRGESEDDAQPSLNMFPILTVFRVAVENTTSETVQVQEVSLEVDGSSYLGGDFLLDLTKDSPLVADPAGSKQKTVLKVEEAELGARETGYFYIMSAPLARIKETGSTALTVEVKMDKASAKAQFPLTEEGGSGDCLAGTVHDLNVRYQYNGNPDLIDKEVFQLINLDYPGLEAVRFNVEQEEYYIAAAELLNYYRNRTSIINPNVNLEDTYLPSGARNIADQALEYRFYVRNFKERMDGKNEVYWSFKTPDGKINWQFQPPGNQDKEFNIQKHRHQWMIHQAKAYHATKDEKYVQSWIEVSKDWWKAYPYKEGQNSWTEGDGGPDMDYNRAWTGLQPAERLLDAMDIFAYMLPAQSFTPEWLSEYLVMMSKTADKIKVSPVRGEDSNIRLAQDQAVATIAMLMPEFAHAGEWMQHGVQEITRHLNNQFNEDGVQNELDPGYHMGVIGDFLKVYDIAKQNNMLSQFPDYYVSRLKNACNFMADIIWPDYSIDFFNDTKAMSDRVLLRNMGLYSSLFPEDKELAYLASEGKTSEPDSKVKIYDKSGWYMMQNGWKKSSMKLIHKNNYNPYNRWHCQSDNGTISIYKNGRCFTPDPGVFTYGGTAQSNTDRRAFASAALHNTVTRNGAEIPWGHSQGRLLKSESTPDYELIVTENASYDDLTHRRAIFMVNQQFYVVVDEAFGSAATNAVLNFSLCTDEKGKGVEVVQTDDFSDRQIYGVHTEFADGNNMLFRTYAEAQGGYNAETGTCYYSERIGEKTRRKRYRVTLAKRENQEARFITVIKPFGQVSEISGLEFSASFKNPASNSPTGAEVEVKLDGQTYNLKYSL